MAKKLTAAEWKKRIALHKKQDRMHVKKMLEKRAVRHKEIIKSFEEWNRKQNKAKPMKAVAKRTVGKTVGSTLPVVGAALIARDVVKALSPSVCRSRGGKWVSGKCVEKKRKVKTKNRPVKDPISKR